MNKIRDIMDVEVLGENKFHSLEEICEFEKKYDISLSDDYKQFVLQYGSGYIKDGYCYKPIEKSPLTPEDGYDSTDYFYGSDIIENIEEYQDELEGMLLPIADANGGDYICIGIKGKYKEKVYYWFHEGSDEMEESLFLIAETFTDFISSFEKHEEQMDISLDDIEIFLDEDLLND